jgi:hypothetical protein
MAPLLPPDSALRVQLEGRWERIERAQERYAALTRQLGSRHWRSVLRGEPGLLAAVREQEPGLDEVLEYVERRAQLERWPQEHPGPAMLRTLRSQRARLAALGRKRLEQWGLRSGASFAEVLGGLESRVHAPVPQPPGESEPVLAAGRSWLTPRRFWLTPERLVWLPWRGEPEQVLLNNLQPERISLLPGGVGVRLEGDRRVSLAGLPRARSLAVLLKLYSRKRRGAGAPVRELITRRGYLDALGTGREEDRLWGLCLLRPGYLAFLPERQPTLRDRLFHLVGAASRPVPEEFRWLDVLVKQLRQLPEEEFDSHLEAFVRARGGSIWPTHELNRSPVLEGSGPRFMVHRRSVVGIPEARQEALEQFFRQHWPALRAARPSWWRRHAPSLMLLLLSLALSAGPLFKGTLPDPGLFLFQLANVPWLLAFMRYARVKGYPPLLGLLSLAPCIGWIILLILQDRNAPRD